MDWSNTKMTLQPYHRSSGYWQRKAERTKNYFENVYKNKLVVCSACSGSGYYDHNGSPKCGWCNGTGKVRER